MFERFNLLQWNSVVIDWVKTLMVVVELNVVHAVERQRVEQFVEPVIVSRGVVDVGVLTQVLAQHGRVRVLNAAELISIIQCHQNDHPLLALHDYIVMQRNFELVHAVRAVNRRTQPNIRRRQIRTRNLR